MKRVRLADLFLIATALLVGRAPDCRAPRTTSLACVATDPTDQDYGASGTAKLTVARTYWDSFYGLWVQGNERELPRVDAWRNVHSSRP